MSELRWHPFLQEWTITATHRQDRTFFPPDDFCPLCPTRDSNQPTEIPRAHFDIAVFENRFPSLCTPPPAVELEPNDFVMTRPSSGVCEVVVYTPEHHATLAGLSPRKVEALCRVWKDRYADLISRDGIEYVYIFENKGKEIGVTLSHPHGQIYAYPFIPRTIQTRLESERMHFEKTGRQLAHDWLNFEMQDGRRIVAESEHFITLVPYFARYPYELHILPKQPIPTLLQMNDACLDALARAILDAAQRLDALFGFSMPYIMSLFQHPTDFTRFEVEFLPPYRTKHKLKYLAGSEAGCGVFINDTLPENTAPQLRGAKPSP